MINARVETVASKPAFRDALRRRRCLIPANGFYEWTTDAGGRKIPHYIRPEGGELLAFAGLWDTWTDATQPHEPALRTCTILTRSAEGPAATLHDRMPLALPPDAWSAWLRSSTQAGEVATLLHASPPALRICRVSARVNTPGNNDAQLVEPAPAQ